MQPGIATMSNSSSDGPQVTSAQENALIDRIVQQVPAAHREELRSLLLDEGKELASADPKLAPLLGQLAALRAARHAPEHARIRALHAEDVRRSESQLRVTVALVSGLGDPDIRATVIRRPGDGGKPLLLLRDEDVTATDLELGLAAAARAAEQYGTNPEKEHRMTLRIPSSKSSSTASIEGQQSVDLLRKATVKDIEGIGHHKTLDVVTARAQRRPNAG
jgi:hypothetical protein